jgi:hypothetical protein
MATDAPRERAKPRVQGRKDYTRAITLIVASALCGAFWIAAAEAIVHAVRR